MFSLLQRRTKQSRSYLDKFDITKHKRYKELSDFDEANLFDVEAFLSTKLKMKKSQIVETYEMGVVEDDA